MVFIFFENIRFIESIKNNSRNVQPEQQQKNTLKQFLETTNEASKRRQTNLKRKPRKQAGGRRQKHKTPESLRTIETTA